MPAERQPVRARRAVRAEGVHRVRVPRRQHAVLARQPGGGVPAAAVRRARPVHRAGGVLQVLPRSPLPTSPYNRSYLHTIYKQL